MADETKVWMGDEPTNCQLCQEPYEGVMLDAKIPGAGWANICLPCAIANNVTLGEGRGQMYVLNSTSGEWEKSEVEFLHLPANTRKLCAES